MKNETVLLHVQNEDLTVIERMTIQTLKRLLLSKPLPGPSVTEA